MLLEVNSTADFQAVEHDENWIDAPSSTVGYLKVSGVNRYGETVTEYMRWTESGTTATEFNIDRRGVHGTSQVDIIGLDNGEDLEVEEVVYLDLPIPKLLIALLTGDLEGQPGKTIPAHWSAGLSADKFDLASFQNIGGDLDNFRLEFIDPKAVDAKRFMAEQCQSPFNLQNLINQDGEIYLSRFKSQPQTSPGNQVVSYDSIVSISDIERDAAGIRNVFSIDWSYRPQKKNLH